MKTSFKMLLAVGGIAGAACFTPLPAVAQPAGFSFRIGDVAFGYRDGYYDHNRRWHAWQARERDWYRNNYRNHEYRDMRHDLDHDGISNRFDRDRDNDGVPNWRDRNPNNPYRR